MKNLLPTTVNLTRKFKDQYFLSGLKSIDVVHVHILICSWCFTQVSQPYFQIENAQKITFKMVNIDS